MGIGPVFAIPKALKQVMLPAKKLDMRGTIDSLLAMAREVRTNPLALERGTKVALLFARERALAVSVRATVDKVANQTSIVLEIPLPDSHEALQITFEFSPIRPPFS